MFGNSPPQTSVGKMPITRAIWSRTYRYCIGAVVARVVVALSRRVHIVCHTVIGYENGSKKKSEPKKSRREPKQETNLMYTSSYCRRLIVDSVFNSLLNIDIHAYMSDVLHIVYQCILYEDSLISWYPNIQ